MNREAFKQRMQNLKSYREQNPGKGYWDFKSYEDGGEVPPTNKPTIVEPIPYTGAGLAALGLVPFVPNIGEAVFKSSKKLSKSKNYIPKVNPNYKQSVIDRALREESTFNKIPNNVTEEIIDQRNRTYELMQEPYARNRAKEIDAQYGTDYLKVYDSMLDKYVNIDEYFKLPDPQYKKMERPTIAAQVTPAKGNTMYFNRDMIKAPEDIPSNVVLHEMGHLVDGAAGMNNEFLKKLGDKSKFIPFNQAKLMYPNYINLEDLIDDQLGRTGTDNATVSDTELQGRRDTHKEKEQGEIQCPEEENR